MFYICHVIFRLGRTYREQYGRAIVRVRESGSAGRERGGKVGEGWTRLGLRGSGSGFAGMTESMGRGGVDVRQNLGLGGPLVMGGGWFSSTAAARPVSEFSGGAP